MGSNQSTIDFPKNKKGFEDDTKGKEFETGSDPTNSNNDNDTKQKSRYPIPTGHEYDLFDKLAAEIPNVIDDESRQQVEDYKQACDGGKGPMAACFATAEFLSLFERKHREAFALYENTCFRPATDKSPMGIPMKDGTKAYPASCFNMAQILMTGKGGNPFDRTRAYQIFDRGCRAGHGGSCFLQAKMMLSDDPSGSYGLGPGIPYDPPGAAKLLQHVCDEHNDPYSCFLLATMLLRGSHVSPETDHVTPLEARGLQEVKDTSYDRNTTTITTPEVSSSSSSSIRKKASDDLRQALPRDPKRAEELLSRACTTNRHAPSCFNLAVMYTQGDEGIPPNEEKAKEFQRRTEELVSQYGGFGM
jgi:TPR repeat protein